VKATHGTNPQGFWRPTNNQKGARATRIHKTTGVTNHEVFGGRHTRPESGTTTRSYVVPTVGKRHTSSDSQNDDLTQIYDASSVAIQYVSAGTQHTAVAGDATLRQARPLEKDNRQTPATLPAAGTRRRTTWRWSSAEGVHHLVGVLRPMRSWEEI